MLELREISDRLELTDLMVRYAHCVDTRDWATWRTLFTPDAHIDYTAMGGAAGGVEETARWLESTLEMFPAFQHLVSNPMLTIDGDTAVGRTMCFNPMVTPNEGVGDRNVFFCGLWYLDTFVRTADGWRISTRTEEKSFVYNMSGAFGSGPARSVDAS